MFPPSLVRCTIYKRNAVFGAEDTSLGAESRLSGCFCDIRFILILAGTQSRINNLDKQWCDVILIY
jgi:hypothetical protein